LEFIRLEFIRLEFIRLEFIRLEFIRLEFLCRKRVLRLQMQSGGIAYMSTTKYSQHSASALYQIGQAAERVGMTIRTLRHYDRIGLLAPSVVSDSQYRLYSDQDITSLHHIRTLKILGFSLEQIKQILSEKSDMMAVLTLQRTIVKQRITLLARAEQALLSAETELRNHGTLDWKQCQHFYEVAIMEQHKTWASQFYSPEAQSVLDERVAVTPHDELVERGHKGSEAWNQLLEEMLRALEHGLSHTSPEAQAFADRWMALVQDFTQGNREIQSGLNRMWGQAHSPEAPAEMHAVYARHGAAFDFIRKVMEYRALNKS
jgi:MerR family transcriptional regulator, thiopeptide resistance regulator